MECIFRLKKQIEKIWDISENCKVIATKENKYIHAMLFVSLTHCDSIQILAERKYFSSVMALLRPLIETTYRSLWLNTCATDEEIRNRIEVDNWKGKSAFHLATAIENKTGRRLRDDYKRYLQDKDDSVEMNTESGNQWNSPLTLDYRPSNLCNLKCRMCGPGSSTEWAKEIDNNISTHYNQLNKMSDGTSVYYFDNNVSKFLERINPDYIILAGYMRIISESLVNDWEGQIINIHPSLLPKYPGLNTHQKALEAKDEYHGTTIHYVINELDAGPIIRQESFKIELNDTVKSLTDRVKQIENRIYPETISKLI